MKKRTALPVLLSIFAALALGATEPEKSSDEELEKLIRTKRWEEANRQVSRMEKAGQCDGPNCLAARALILKGQGKVEEAQEAARQAGAKLAEGQALSAWRYNEVGALLYRGAAGKVEDLRGAESAFRRASVTYQGHASNIRFNLAVVLNQLGNKAEAKKLMDQIEAEGGILVDGKMAILGGFKEPGK